jgi:trigger factor
VAVLALRLVQTVAGLLGFAPKGVCVKIDVKEVSELRREVSVEIPTQTVQAEVDKKLADLGKEAKVDGFRKGKVPLSVVRTKFGEQARAEAIDELVRQSLTQAVRDNELRMAGQPTMTAFDFDDAGVLTYKAEVEVFPVVEKVAFDGLELQAVEQKVEDEEVDEVVEQYRKQLSELRPLQRAAEESDIIVCDLTKEADTKEVLETDSFPDSQIDLANPATIREFREQLPGLKAGDEKQIEVVYEDDYSDPNFAGARIMYNCSVKSVNERILPEVNDQFATRTGLGESALEVRLKIRQHLLAEREAGQRRAHRQELVGLICGKNDVPIPEGLISKYLDGLIQDFRQRNEEFDEEELREKYRPVGINMMRWDLLWHTLVDQERIEVLPEDTENWIKGFAAHHGVPIEQARESLLKAGKAQELRESILEEKVLNFLMDQATIVRATK